MPAQGRRSLYESGECEVDLARRELRARGVVLPVGARAFGIIEALVQSAGELVTKDELMDHVWPSAIVEEHTLQVHISAVRKALGPYRTMLKTESGRGYRLLGTWAVRDHGSGAAPIGLQELRAPDESPATNFPPIVTRLIGQSAAALVLRDLVSAYRVVTLTGPGGIGKTTLAIEVARHLLADFGDGGWLVELASVADPDIVPSVAASVLGLKLVGDTISGETVARAIGGQNLLLILDNCEHVIDAAANLVEMLVRLCPRTTILATSREVFRIDGEYVYRVPALDVPAVGEDEPAHILGHSAVELFITRARALDADFSSRVEQLPAIAAICRQLDGIPLAIEFAAARAATLGIQHVAVGLRDRFALLTSGRRTALPRHRTLRATFDWSYELLPETERSLLCRLATFSGGFTLDAAAAVMNDTGLDPSAVMDGIANLATKSLVTLDKSEATARWYLLETIRVYALEKLTQQDQANTAARHHAAYFRDLFVTLASGSKMRLSNEDLTRGAREIDNVRAALDWSFSRVGDPAIGIDLTAAYTPVWLHLSLISECRERCDRALRCLESDANPNAWPQMWLQIALGNALINTMGPSEQAQAVLTRALEVADTLNDLDAQAGALSALSTVHFYRGEHAKVRVAVERHWQITHQIGDPASIVVADRLMGTTLVTLGRHREAQQCLERVLQAPVSPLDQRRSIWHHSEHRAIARAMLARALWLQGFAEKALYESQASLEELWGRDHQLTVCRVLYSGTGRIAPMTGDFGAAERGIARLIEVSTRLNASFSQTAGRFLKGKLMVERREFATGSTVLRDAFDTCRQTGWRMSYPEFKGALAEAFAGLGQLDEALEAVNDAMASAGQREDGQVWYLPELIRIKGEMLLQKAADRSASAAEDCFKQAGEMAREQGALFWELRVALSLARLRITQGRQTEATQILLPVYDRHTEGFETADLRSARATLALLPPE